MYSASTATDLDFSEHEFNSVSFDLDNVNEELMNASLGTGIDLIPGLLLRHTSSSLSFHVLKLFEAIVESSVYPLSWKRAAFTPVYKSGNKSLIVSYRSISILPKLSLVFEKLLFKFLYPIIKNQLSNYQFGFRKGRSTVTQLLRFLNELYTNLVNGEISYCIYYLDYSKAFDKVAHSILLHKLSLFGIGGNLLRLISSYLSNQVQCVKVDHFYSRWETIASGVRQGSELGPLLLIVLINDLPSVCLSSIMFLYANDSKAINTNLKNLKLNIHACISWAEQNLMDFNASKTQFIAIGETSDKFLKFGGMSLSPSNVVKDLGVMVSDNLKWEKHISKRISICYSLLSRLRWNLPPNLPFSTKLNMYKAYILPSLLYASEIWHPTSSDLRKLELVQKRCCKWICNGNDYKHRSVKFSLLPISCVLQYKDLVMLNRVLLGLYDFPVSDLFHLEYKSRCLRSSAKPTFVVKKSSRKTTRGNFMIRSTTYANDLHRKTALNVFEDAAYFRKKLGLRFFESVNVKFDNYHFMSLFCK